jgi:beta-glucosidase
MRGARITGAFVVAGIASLVLAGCTGGGDGEADGSTSDGYVTREVTDGKTAFVAVDNPEGGADLSYSPDSGVELIDVESDGKTYAFKDMNGNGELDAWEDWREPAAERAADLAEQLSIEQIAGLMLFSSHERSPADGLTEAQRTYISEDKLRNVLNAGPSDVAANVTWVNEAQAYAESLATEDAPYVPVNFSSDPRSEATADAPFVAEGESISQWPSSLGLAATFDPETAERFAAMVSAEYRALGITTALSPQIDLATDPRWVRVSGTFGENVELASEMAAAYVEGFQSTYDESGENQGWGPESVPTMIKHLPGDGMGEGGRESHFEGGKYAVYPGGNLDEHLEPFLAALDSASVMTSYSIGLDADGEPVLGERAGSAYDKDKVDLLRADQDYQGVIVTDWGVTAGGPEDPDALISTAWGMEDASIDERHYAILRNGVDMFGGNNAVAPVLAAHEMWQADFEAGENDIDADTRFRESGARILTMFFAPGLYDDPYLELEASEAAVGSGDKIEAGNQAQLDSVVLLKNENEVIASAEAADWSDKTVYIPRSYARSFPSLFGPGSYSEGPTLNVEIAEQYFGAVVTDEPVLDENEEVTSYETPDLSDVDLVLVGMDSPDNGDTFSAPGKNPDDGSYYPLSLQYRPYTADGANVREVSISGDILEDGSRENRSYHGQSSRIANEADLDTFERAVAAVEESGEDIPVIAVLKAKNPVIPAEFEADADAIAVGFGVSEEALFQVALGLHEPQGRLPIGFPASMDAVEAQLEDVGEDAEAYVDAAGNEYAFGFGLNWSGVID